MKTSPPELFVERAALHALQVKLATRRSKELPRGVAASDVRGHWVSAVSVVSDCSAAAHVPGNAVVMASADEQCARLSSLADASAQKRFVIAGNTAAVRGLLDRQSTGCEQPFMLGVTNPAQPSLADCQRALLRRMDLPVGTASAEAEAWLERSGLTQRDGRLQQALDELLELWQRDARLRTLGDAVVEALRWPIMDSRDLPMAPAAWRKFAHERSLLEVRELVERLGINLHWDCESARTLQGHYQVRHGIELATARALTVAPHADMLWLIAPEPDLRAASAFAHAVRARFPEMLLAYQLTARGEVELSHAAAWQAFGNDLAHVGFVLHVSAPYGVGASYLRDPARFLP